MKREKAMDVMEAEVLNKSRGVTLAERAAIADTSRARRRGLLGSERLEDGRALVLIPCRQVHTCGMRYPIDVVFADRSLRVLKVTEGMKPWRLGQLVIRAALAMELPAGKVAATGTTRGDVLEIRPYAHQASRPPAREGHRGSRACREAKAGARGRGEESGDHPCFSSTNHLLSRAEWIAIHRERDIRFHGEPALPWTSPAHDPVPRSLIVG